MGSVANNSRHVCTVIFKTKSQSQVGHLFALLKYLSKRKIRLETTKNQNYVDHVGECT